MNIFVNKNMKVVVPINRRCKLYVEEEGSNKYSWFVRTDSYLEWIKIGESFEVFTMAPNMSKHNVEYKCEIQDENNQLTEYIVTISWTTFIIETPESVKLTPGEKAELFVKVNPRIINEVEYQWQWRASEDETWKNVNKNANNQHLTTETFSHLYEGYQYRVKATYNGVSSWSKPITVNWNKLIEDNIPDTINLGKQRKIILNIQKIKSIEGNIDCVWEEKINDNWELISTGSRIVIKKKQVNDCMYLRCRAKRSESKEQIEDIREILIKSDKATNTGDDLMSLESQKYVLIDALTGDVIKESESNCRIAPNSCVKILTGILALENLDCSEWIKVTDIVNCFEGIKGTNINLKEGELIQVESLIYALMLGSANDVANVIAQNVSGGLESFVELMNAKAGEIGMKNSHFTNPHGLFKDDNYTTAYDLAILARYAMQNEKFRSVCVTAEYVICETNMTQERVLTNHNRLITDGDTYFTFDNGAKRVLKYKYAIGIKNGFTTQGKASLVAAASKDGREVICAIGETGQRERFTDAIKLFDWYYS